MAEASCYLCGWAKLTALPLLPQSMLSDGRVVDTPLAKLSCERCGAVMHVTPPDPTEVQSWYATDYSLPAAAPGADRDRARRYRRLIEPLLAIGARDVLEIGAGSGALMLEMSEALPGAELLGVEPASAGDIALSDRVRLRRGDISAVPDIQAFDVAITVNVIEHTTDPVSFLLEISQRLRPGGEIIVICPDGDTPNVELLFTDHIHSLSSAAMQQIAHAAGLSITGSGPAGANIGDFRYYVLRSGRQAPPHLASDLAVPRSEYLRRWQLLDEALAVRAPKGELLAFGAGQMAALLRAYAPATWSRVSAMTLDAPAEAWSLDKPILAYPDIPNSANVLVAAAPASQQKIATRLKADGHLPICFDDMIPR